MSRLAGLPCVFDDVARLQGLVPRLRMGVNDRRRQRSNHANSAPSVTRHRFLVPSAATRAANRRDGGRGPLSPNQAAGVCRTVRIAAKGPLQQLHRNGQHQASRSGHEARIAVRRFFSG